MKSTVHFPEQDKMTQLTLPTSGNSSSSGDIDANQCLSSFSTWKALIALIDSRALIREGITRLLNDVENFKLIPVSHCSELLGKSPEVLSEVEIVLLNIGSAAIGDPEIVRNIALLNEALLNTSIIVICDREDSYQIGEALRQGTRGYIPTTLTSQILIGALRLVQAGGTFIPAGAVTEMLSRKPISPEAAKAEVVAPDFCGLTRRQREVFNLLRQGRPNKVIAQELDMSESTVKVHVRNIMLKMRVTNRTEAALLGQLSPPAIKAREDSDQSGSCPELVKQFAHSSG
jgi:DNA-binding NarL/FixJ family response regulator